MLVCNVGFINTNGQRDETQLDIEECFTTEEMVVDTVNVILSLKDEMDIRTITYTEYLDCIDEEE